MKAGTNKWLLVACLLLCSLAGNAQLIQYGKITYERKTNLLKKFPDERMKQWLNDQNKVKIDHFNLYFTDTASAFTYVTPDTQDPMSWATTKNSVYQNIKNNQRIVFMDLWGTQLTLTDSLKDRQWKITDKTRKIAGYDCIRAIWQKDDSTRIHAWFAPNIIPTIGPESLQGLPGAILGVATEDGGVVFFATKVEIVEPTAEQMAIPKKKGKDYTEASLLEKMIAETKGQPYGNAMIKEMFFW